VPTLALFRKTTHAAVLSLDTAHNTVGIFGRHCHLNQPPLYTKSATYNMPKPNKKDKDDEKEEKEKKEEKKGEKKSKRKIEKGENEDDADVVELQKPKKKRATARKKPDEKTQADDSDNGDDEKKIETDPVKARIAASKRSKIKKSIAYRKLAREAGYHGGSGIDGGNVCLLSLSDAKRMMRFYPPNAKETSYDDEEMNKRKQLANYSVPPSAARETQVRADALLRKVMNEVVLRAIETGKKTVTAYDMMCVLRPYSEKMMFTSVLPCTGQIRHAQNEGLLKCPVDDFKKKEEETA